MKHPHTILFPLALASLTALGQAQATRVIPAIFATTEGNDLGSYPFGRASARSQQIWNGTSLAGTVAVISSLSYRADNDNSSGSSAVTFGSVTVDVSDTTVSPSAMTTTFASNVTGTPTRVFNGPLSLPAYTSTPGGSAPFAATIPFGTPFSFFVAGKHLLVDLTSTSPTPSSPSWVMDVALPGGATRSLGSTGPTSGGFDQLRLLVAANGTTGQGRYAGLVPGDSIVVFTQANRAFTGQMMFGTTRLPAFDLGPYGAPSNTLEMLPDLTLPFVMTSGIGGYRGTFTLPIPAQNNLVGGVLYAQAFVVDTPANSLGIVTTNAYELKIGEPGPHMSQQLNSQVTTATTGTFQYVSGILGGPIVQFSGVFQ